VGLAWPSWLAVQNDPKKIIISMVIFGADIGNDMIQMIHGMSLCLFGGLK
jgi:hypothetical protein